MRNGVKIVAVMMSCLSATACLTQQSSVVSDSNTASPPPVPGGGNDGFQVGPVQPPTPSNPDDGGSTPPPPTPVVNPYYIVTLQNGSVRTKEMQLSLDMDVVELVTQMKVSRNGNCDGGVWEPYRSQVLLNVENANQRQDVSVRFRDFEGFDSDCFARSVLHDNLPPKIVFNRYPPAQSEEGVSHEIIYTIEDNSPISDSRCALDGVVRACPSGSVSVKLDPLARGIHSFSVTATDELGQSSTAQVQWEVTLATRELVQLTRIIDQRMVDILMIIDNSGSMAYEQQSMASRVSNFLSILEGLDYQIGVTTTDPRDIALGDGRLIPLYGTPGNYILTSQVPRAEAQDRLGRTLQRPEVGSGSEQAIRAAYRAIERAQANSSPGNSQLFREGAQFAAVVISDEDESDNTPKNDPAQLVQLINSRFSGQKAFTWHSIITRPGDTACRSTHGAAYGNRYADLTRLTGGILGSVCEMDYAAQVQGIANGIRQLVRTISLQCAPLAGFRPVITKDGLPWTESFDIEGVNLKFTNPLPAGDYQVTYRCLR